jgi:hypothetical protein
MEILQMAIKHINIFQSKARGEVKIGAQVSSKSTAPESWQFTDRSDSHRLAQFLTSAGNVISILLEEGASGTAKLARFVFTSSQTKKKRYPKKGSKIIEEKLLQIRPFTDYLEMNIIK